MTLQEAVAKIRAAADVHDKVADTEQETNGYNAKVGQHACAAKALRSVADEIASALPAPTGKLVWDDHNKDSSLSTDGHYQIYSARPLHTGKEWQVVYHSVKLGAPRNQFENIGIVQYKREAKACAQKHADFHQKRAVVAACGACNSGECQEHGR